MSKKLGQMNQKIWTIWAKNSSNYQKGSSNEHKNTSNKPKKIVQMSKRKYFKMNQKDSSKEQLLFSSFELNILFIWTIFVQMRTECYRLNHYKWYHHVQL